VKAIVIASEAKQSSLDLAKDWIASSQALLAMTVLRRTCSPDGAKRNPGASFARYGDGDFDGDCGGLRSAIYNR
jgi:hypothetical protein